MRSMHVLWAVLPFLISAAPCRVADCSRTLRRMEGWTIAKVGAIKGTFNGCEFDRLVELQDGTVLRCAAYGYQYAYMPDAVVFTKGTSIGDSRMVMVKLMVEDEIYDMSPILVK